MAIPQWTGEYIKRGLGSVSEQVTRPETVHRVRTTAADLLSEFPDAAARGIDLVLGRAKSTVQLARQWARHRVAAQTPVINALGVLIDPALAGQPLADAAVAAAIEHTDSFTAQHPDADQRLQRQLRRGIESAGCSLSPGTEAAVASGIEAALLAVAAWARSEARTVIVPRCAAIAIAGGVALPELLEATGASLREVGPSNEMTRSDWERARIEDNAIILLAGVADPQSLRAANVRATVVRLLTIGTLGTSPEPIAPAVPTATETLQTDGVDLVILPGDGLMGGPRCGLILGRRDHVSAITRTPCWPAVTAPRISQMMLAATLTAEPEGKSRIDELLATSVENLQHRAERLMMRLGGAEPEIHGEISDQLARVARERPYRLPSRQLRLRRQDLSASQWAAKLAGRLPAVLAETQDDTLVVDLRWVRPAEDAALAEALLGAPVEERREPPGPADADDRSPGATD